MTTPVSIESAYFAYRSLFIYASPTAVAEGMTWYANANRVAFDLTTMDASLSIEQASSIIAAFSPRVHWSRNIMLAKSFVAGLPVGCLKTSIKNAERARLIGFDALNGLKTNAFARAVAGDKNAVVIDTWMIKPFGMKSVNKSEYMTAANAVRRVATEFNISPADMQAIIWVASRGKAA